LEAVKAFVKSLSKITDRKPKSLEYSIVVKFGTLIMVFESFDNLKWAYTLWTDKKSIYDKVALGSWEELVQYLESLVNRDNTANPKMDVDEMLLDIEKKDKIIIVR